jgi:predicted enzyme involved in methoxymalonyl-ACP biosynthesis
VTDGRLLIDAWLMSCRVLGRGVEQLLFNHLLAAAPGCGAGEILGFYRRTARNGIVKDHYRNLGFTRVDGDNDVETWRLEIGLAAPVETCISCNDVQLV